VRIFFPFLLILHGALIWIEWAPWHSLLFCFWFSFSLGGLTIASWILWACDTQWVEGHREMSFCEYMNTYTINDHPLPVAPAATP